MPGEKEATGRDGTGQTPFEEANPRMGVVLLLLLWSTTFGEGGEFYGSSASFFCFFFWWGAVQFKIRRVI